MNENIKHLVVVSDLHVGSTVGLMAPTFVRPTEGTTICANKVQRWMWKRWRSFWDCFVSGVVGKDAYAIVWNGDLIDGFHHGTKQVWSHDPVDHAMCAVEIMRPEAAKAAMNIVVAGTESHTKDAEQTIARAIDATPDPATGKAAFDRAFIRISGCRVACWHHGLTGGRKQLQGTKITSPLYETILSQTLADQPAADVLITSHAHQCAVWRDPAHDKLAISTPPWQLATRFVHKVVPNTVPHVGGFVLDFTDRQGVSVCPRVHEFVRTVPTPKEVMI